MKLANDVIKKAFLDLQKEIEDVEMDLCLYGHYCQKEGDWDDIQYHNLLPVYHTLLDQLWMYVEEYPELKGHIYIL